MQTITNISIPQPCHQNWNDMTPASQGRHCQMCQKNVVDFTRMTDTEIINYLGGNTNVCGRFDDIQMQAINTKLATDIKPKFSWKRLAFAAAITGLFITSKASAQRVEPDTHQSPVNKKNNSVVMGEPVAYRLIKGRITGDDDNGALQGVSVTVKGTNMGTITNANGEFALNVPMTADSLTMSFIGYQNYEAKIADLSTGSNCISLKMRAAVLGRLISVVKVKKAPLHKRVWNKVKRVF